MKNYSELTATPLSLSIAIITRNNPSYTVEVDGRKFERPKYISLHIDSQKSFSITVDILTPDSAVIIDNIVIDNINIIPTYNHLVDYNTTTNYIDSGKWTLTFNRPFYQWLHQATAQGWLLEP